MTTVNDEAEPSAAPARRAYVLALFSLLYCFYMLDRNAALVTQELIKEDFALSDSEVGLVVGTLWGVSYALAGLPLGFMTDRVHRVRLLSALVAIWSGLTGLCALATSFWHLALARIGVGAAEAGGSPLSASILSDMFPPERRASALAIFYAGAPVGTCVSLMLGGFIAEQYGWRAVFLIYGLPGLLLALFLYLTVTEPARKVAPKVTMAGWWTAVRDLLRNPSIVSMLGGSMLFTLSISAVLSWVVPFLIRVHGFDLSTSGVIIGLAAGIGGSLGAVLAGVICDRVRRFGAGGPMIAVAVFAFANGLFGFGAVVVSDYRLCVAFLAGWALTCTTYSAPVNAQLSELAPAGSTGIAFSLFAVTVNLVGAGLGPLTVGIISDLTTAAAGPGAALRYGLILAALINLVGGTVYLLAGRLRSRFVVGEPALTAG
jgi:predicted MFS family arabinose efflux permease